MAQAPVDGDLCALEELFGESVESPSATHLAPLPPPGVTTTQGQPLAAQDQQHCMLTTDAHTIADEHTIAQIDVQLDMLQLLLEELDAAIDKACQHGAPLWISPGQGGNEPRRRQHNFFKHNLIEGARIDFYRGVSKDDLMNIEWRRGGSPTSPGTKCV